MPIAFPQILNVALEPESWSWDERDCLIYALAIGFGRDPLDRRELEYVSEGPNFRTATAFASVSGASAGLRGEVLGINPRLRVHGEARAVFLAPVPVGGTGIGHTRVIAAYDHGPKVGAAIISRTDLTDAAGAPLATVDMTSFARGDGGFGGPPGPASPALPDRAPDRTAEVVTLPNQALLFRLLRDRNKLHSDPGRAAAAGFPRPILHGLCLFGIAWRALLMEFADWAPEAIRELSVRFARPVFPGDTISFRFWRQDGEVVFEASVVGRGAVLRNGRAVID